MARPGNRNYGRLYKLPSSLHNSHGGHHLCLLMGGRKTAAKTQPPSSIHQGVNEWPDHTHHNEGFAPDDCSITWKRTLSRPSWGWNRASPGAYHSPRGSFVSNILTLMRSPFQQCPQRKWSKALGTGTMPPSKTQTGWTRSGRTQSKA